MITTLALFAFSMNLTAETAQTTPANPSTHATPSHSIPNGNYLKKDEVMEEDQIDGTDVLAIPFDDSAVEDEQMLDRADGVKYEPFVPTKDTKK